MIRLLPALRLATVFAAAGFWIWAWAMRVDPLVPGTVRVFLLVVLPVLLLGRLPAGAERPRGEEPTLLVAILLGALAVASWFTLPWLFWPALVGMAARLAASLLPRASEPGSRWRAGPSWLGERRRIADILLAQAAVHGLYLWIEPYAQGWRIPPAWVSSVLGLAQDAAPAAEGVALATPAGAWVHGVSINHFALYAALPLLIACFAATRRRWSRLLAAAVLILGGCLLFWALSGSLAAAWEVRFAPLQEWHLVLLCFLPTVLAAAWVLRPSVGEAPPEAAPPRPLAALELAGLALAGALLFAAVGLHDPGVRKAGRVLIDEGHSTWEPVEVDFGRDAFGSRTVYNMLWFRRLLEAHFAAVELTGEPLDAALLAEVDVLVIKTPTRRYEPEEVAAVERWVRGGGGLWLIGDHTNIFGMATYLNDFGRRFGVSFRADALIDPRTVGGQLTVFDRGRAHPSVRHVERVDWMTSCSLAADPLRARPVAAGELLFQDLPSFKDVRLFGDMKWDGREHYGSFLQATASRVGRGRVLTFTDSTVFSTFALALPGWPEWVVGSAEWLNRRNRLTWQDEAAGLAALALLALLVWRARRGPVVGGWGAWLAPLFLGYAMAALGGQLLDARAYPEPRPIRPVSRAAFFYDSRAAYLPLWPEKRGEDDRLPDNYHSLLVALQRVDYFPEVLRERTPLDAFDLVVLFSEPRAAGAGELDAYLRAGGRAVLLRGRSDGGGRVLAAYLEELAALADAALPRVVQADAETADEEEAEGAAAAEAAEPPAPAPAAGRLRLEDLKEGVTLEGGEVVISGARGPVAVEVPYGEGALVVVSSLELFSNQRLATPFSPPTRERYELYQVLFDLLRPLRE